MFIGVLPSAHRWASTSIALGAVILSIAGPIAAILYMLIDRPLTRWLYRCVLAMIVVAYAALAVDTPENVIGLLTGGRTPNTRDFPLLAVTQFVPILLLFTVLAPMVARRIWSNP
jgi:hypothetical protein